jgi:hypothetical protein
MIFTIAFAAVTMRLDFRDELLLQRVIDRCAPGLKSHSYVTVVSSGRSNTSLPTRNVIRRIRSSSSSRF